MRASVWVKTQNTDRYWQTRFAPRAEGLDHVDPAAGTRRHLRAVGQRQDFPHLVPLGNDGEVGRQLERPLGAHTALRMEQGRLALVPPPRRLRQGDPAPAVNALYPAPRRLALDNLACDEGYTA